MINCRNEKISKYDLVAYSENWKQFIRDRPHFRDENILNLVGIVQNFLLNDIVIVMWGSSQQEIHVDHLKVIRSIE